MLLIAPRRLTASRRRFWKVWERILLPAFQPKTNIPHSVLALQILTNENGTEISIRSKIVSV